LAGLSEAITVSRIKARENFGELIGFVAELDEDRGQQTTGILFGGIPEIKIEICECG
jgi:hypothetical protein